MFDEVSVAEVEYQQKVMHLPQQEHQPQIDVPIRQGAAPVSAWIVNAKFVAWAEHELVIGQRSRLHPQFFFFLFPRLFLSHIVHPHSTTYYY
jgi:hypothetical protein